jgi:molybdopterin-containing oxidoreductase family iron-sulfur binding subunit
MLNDPLPRYWKSLGERAHDVALLDAAADEFPEPIGPRNARVGRRGFLKAAGFSVGGALAAGCQRGPVERAIPFLNKPEEVTPGRSLWYASTCHGCSAGCGVLVKARDGRPIKLEGNPDHPLNRGGLCAAGQASVLGLYDARRHVAPARHGAATTWAEIDRDVTARLEDIRRSGGAVRLLSGTVTSPTLAATIDRFLARFADGRHVVYDALSSSAVLDAHARTHGRRVLPHYLFDRAKVIVGVDADFLGTWISPVEFTRAYRDGRSLEGTPPRCSYHVQFEGRLSLTGAKADARVRIAPDEEADVIEQVALRIARLAGMAFEPGGGQPEVPAAVLDDVARRVWEARGESLLVSGSQDVGVQVIVNFVNHLAGNYGATLDLDRPSRQRQGADEALVRLLEELRAGSIAALLVADANPVYDLPMGDEFGRLAAHVPLFMSLAGAPDETSALAGFVCPDHHPLESWGDAEPVAGWVGVTQPVVRPLGGTRAIVESLATWMGDTRAAYDLVREHWEQAVFPRHTGGASFQAFWDRSVHDGVVSLNVPGDPSALFERAEVRPLVPAPRLPADGLVLALYPTVALLDGRQAHNAWLQELPDPISKVTWDNYASLSPATAARLNVSDGDVVRLTAEGGGGAAADLVLPVYVQPGQHDRVVAVALGYGRSGTDRFTDVGPRWIDARPGVGNNGLVGTNAAPCIAVRDGRLTYAAHRVTITRVGTRHELATTQHHHSIMEPRRISSAGARPIVRETTVSHLDSLVPPAPSAAQAHEDLWPDDHPVTGHRWGMVIDLNACTGCSGCVVACQAENNIPVVGRDEVRRQREMHWLRIDRYFTDAAEDVDIVHQPMLCQHCANASCETVCPVLATVHSDEGLNEQVYNRCVGTRYCANNCPYKVRRFNWFTYARPSDRENLVLNPDVAVRTRGVMEKCSFCVQRIQEAKIDARRRGVRVADGDARTACEQSCPATAIVFGDLNDPQSRVAALAADGRYFRVLEELNERPSVGYLAVVRNRTGAEGETHHD